MTRFALAAAIAASLFTGCAVKGAAGLTALDWARKSACRACEEALR